MKTKHQDTQLAWISVLTGTHPRNLERSAGVPIWEMDVYKNRLNGKETTLNPHEVRSQGVVYPNIGRESSAYAAFRAGMENPRRKTIPGYVRARCQGLNGQLEKYYRKGQQYRTR